MIGARVPAIAVSVLTEELTEQSKRSDSDDEYLADEQRAEAHALSMELEARRRSVELLDLVTKDLEEEEGDESGDPTSALGPSETSMEDAGDDESGGPTPALEPAGPLEQGSDRDEAAEVNPAESKGPASASDEVVAGSSVAGADREPAADGSGGPTSVPSPASVVPKRAVGQRDGRAGGRRERRSYRRAPASGKPRAERAAA